MLNYMAVTQNGAALQYVDEAFADSEKIRRAAMAQSVTPSPLFPLSLLSFRSLFSLSALSLSLSPSLPEGPSVVIAKSLSPPLMLTGGGKSKAHSIGACRCLPAAGDAGSK